jgi:hypothetical protein
VNESGGEVEVGHGAHRRSECWSLETVCGRESGFVSDAEGVCNVPHLGDVEGSEGAGFYC